MCLSTSLSVKVERKGVNCLAIVSSTIVLLSSSVLRNICWPSRDPDAYYGVCFRRIRIRIDERHIIRVARLEPHKAPRSWHHGQQHPLNRCSNLLECRILHDDNSILHGGLHMAAWVIKKWKVIHNSGLFGCQRELQAPRWSGRANDEPQWARNLFKVLQSLRASSSADFRMPQLP